MAALRAKALERAEDARREVREERKLQTEAAQALAARLQKRPVTLALKGGDTIKDAIVTSFTAQNVQLRLPTGGVSSVSWDAVDYPSLRAAADALFLPTSAKEQFERGRLFIARRLWKDALEAFGRAEKLGDGYQSRVLEFKDLLERLATGQGVFHGAARQIGRSSLLLSYDFRDASQLEDWTPGLTLSGASAILESKSKAGVALRGGSEDPSSQLPVIFIRELGLTMRFTSTAPVTFSLFVGPKKGYELELSPTGAVLARVDPDGDPKTRHVVVARSDRVKIAFGKTHDLRLRTKARKLTLSLDGQEGVSLEDPDPPSGRESDSEGLLGITIPGGRLKIDAPLLIEGTLKPEELETRLGSSEVLARRALDPELEEIRERRITRAALRMLGEGKTMALTADDVRFLDRIKAYSDKVEGYERLKREFASYQDGSLLREFSLEDWAKRLTSLLEKYPDVPGLHYLHALYLDEAQSRTPAQAALRKALDLYPEFAEALVLQAEHLLEAYDLDGAQQAVNKAIDVKPDDASAYVLRARLTFTRSRTSEEDLLEDLMIAHRLDPSDPEAIYFLRVLQRQLRGPRDMGCRFDAATPHYQVTSDISPEASKRYGDALEAAWGHYTSTFKDVPRDGSRAKPRVAIFQTAENYYTYFEILSETRGEETLGVFRDQFNELVLFDTADRTETMHTLFHEAFHHFMHLMVSETPPYWYNEGMAEYMGAIEVENGKVTKKALPLRGRLLLLRVMVEVNHVIPFERIMCETPREFYGPEAGLNYAQAWSMIHFFHEASNGKYRPLIERYFRELLDRKTPRQAYEAVFKDQAEALEKEWRAYVRQMKL
jgi:tetratricopeptide (TPR) repeat protein